MTAAEKASPVRMAAGTARTASGPRGMPKIVSTPRKASAMVSARNPIHSSSPMSRWRTSSGVASIAS
jgi:hypothetical protein